MHFRDLNESQILALAITAEEQDSRIYRDFAESLRKDYPTTAELFTTMAAEEDGHRHRLIALFQQRFGEHIPLIRRQDVKGFVARRPVWQFRPLGVDVVRRQARQMEMDAARFCAGGAGAARPDLPMWKFAIDRSASEWLIAGRAEQRPGGLKSS